MSYATVTPRDLLALDPNPARIPVKRIQALFGIGERQAGELRRLACRAPVVLAAQWAADEALCNAPDAVSAREGQGGAP